MEKPPAKLFYYFLFSLGMIFVGSAVVINKELMASLPIFFIVEVRVFVSSIVFYIIVKIKKEIFPKLEKKDYIVLFMQSAVGIFLYSFLFFYGLRYASGIETGIILSLSPVFATIIAFFFLKEKSSYKRWIGVILAVLGIIIVNSNNFGVHGIGQYNMYRILGNIMIIGVALSEAIYEITSKYTREKLSAYQMCLIIMVISFVLFLPFSIYQATKINFALFDVKLILQFLYYIIFVGIVPYILTSTAIKHISATTAGVLTVIISISGIALSIIFLGEKLQPAFLIGSLVSLVGVVIVTKLEK